MKNAFEYEQEIKGLREELASAKQHRQKMFDLKEDYRLRLTAAEQRIADLCGLLVRTLPVVRMVGRREHLCDYAMAGNIQAEIEITLNPIESGASE